MVGKLFLSPKRPGFMLIANPIYDVAFKRLAIDEKARKELDEELYYLDYVESMFGEHHRKIEDLSQKVRKAAKELKLAGVPLGKIVESTGVSLEEIERL